MKKTDIVKASLVCLLSATSSYGAGFSLYEGSAAGNADTAGTTAKGGEPGAIYFNPAAISGLPGTQVQIGVTAVAPQDSVTGVNPYTGKTYKQEGREKVWPLPHAYVTHQINNDFWLGLGLFTRAGLGAEFPGDWFGRYNNISAKITTFDVSPVVAWKATDWLSLSAGFTVQYFDIVLKQKIDAAGIAGLRQYNDPSYSPYDVYQELCGDDIGFGADFGIQLKPVEKVNIGVGYHSRITQECEGKADYTKPAAVNAVMPAFFNDTTLNGKVTLPDMVMTAITYDITDDLTVGLGATYTSWSTYEELKINLDAPILPGKTTLKSEKNWSDVMRYTGGLSYKATDAVTLRASYTFDDSPFNKDHLDYIIPADTRHIMAVGAGYKTGNWVYDFSYFYEIIEDADVTPHVASGVYPGEFTDGIAHSVGLSVTRKF